MANSDESRREVIFPQLALVKLQKSLLVLVSHKHLLI